MEKIIHNTKKFTLSSQQRASRTGVWQVGAIEAIVLLVACLLLCAICAPTAMAGESSASASTGPESGGAHTQAELPNALLSPYAWTAKIVASEGAVPDPKLLKSIMGEDKAVKLLVEALFDSNRYWIAAHPEALDADGPEVQAKLLRLAADEDAAVTYVREFNRWYPDELDHVIAAGAPDKDVAGAYPTVAVGKTNVPHLYQWDQRWGYTVYSSTAFGMSGCGPTAFAMAYCSAVGDDDFTPYDAALAAWEAGFMDQYEGTYAGFLAAAADKLGMRYAAPNVDASTLRHAIENGWVVVANVGHGYFSRYNGHYLVIAGLTGDGKVVLNDPYSVVNSQKTWDIDFIVSQSMQFYALARTADEQIGMAKPPSN